ncbi:MAG: cation-transporting P-type ATPase [Clostridium sartagoforme]|nr:cation-transporting P-type ATPase [Clostridium sartagoforme]
MEKYYSKSWIKVVEELNSDVHKGLYEYDCTLRREVENNKINLPYYRGFLKLFLELLKQRYLIIYLIFIIFFLYNKFYIMGIILAIILIISLLMKFYIEIHKEKEIEILQNLNTSQVLVLREGIEKLVEAEELVKGDIIYFRKNSIIAADIRIIESENLKVDEKGVTGDNLIKEKDSIKIDYNVASIAEVSNMIFRGSVVKEGSGKGIVVEVGNNTQLGKLINIISNSNNKRDILIRDTEISILKVVICLLLVQAILGLVFPGNVLNKTELWAQGIFAVVSIIFPVILLYYGKAFKKKILIEDNIELNNISTLSLIDKVRIFFMDKIGNISKNELYVNKLYTNEQIYLSNNLDTGDINIKRLIDISLLCNNAKYNSDNTFTKGNIFDRAYASFGLENSIYKDKLQGLNKRKFELINYSESNIITTLNKNKKGYRANSKGKLDSILNCCTHILINGIEREITSEDIMKIKLADLSFSKEGLLTEAFAYRSFNYEPSKYENIESNLVFVGIIALENPLIDDVVDDIKTIIDAGILPIVFTDENSISAEFFGRKIGLISSEDQIASGVELEELNEEDLIKIVSKARIYCKVNPETRNKIISLYNNDGYEFVAEGQSLADLSVISLANVGIVKGKVSMLLRRIGDVFIENSSIKALFNLKNRENEIKEANKAGLSIYSIICLAEVIFLNFQYYLGNSTLTKEYYIIFLNLFFMIPVILVNILCGNKSYIGRKAVLRGVLFSSIPVVSMYFIKGNYDIIGFLLIGGMAILDMLINCNIFTKNNLKYIKLFIISILIYALSLIALILLANFKFDIMMLIIIGWVLVIFILADLIIKKW